MEIMRTLICRKILKIPLFKNFICVVLAVVPLAVHAGCSCINGRDMGDGWELLWEPDAGEATFDVKRATFERYSRSSGEEIYQVTVKHILPDHRVLYGKYSIMDSECKSGKGTLIMDPMSPAGAQQRDNYVRYARNGTAIIGDFLCESGENANHSQESQRGSREQVKLANDIGIRLADQDLLPRYIDL